MSDHPYLIAIALIEQNGKRSMPLGGKSLSNFFESDDPSGDKTNVIVLELLLRLIQRTEDFPLKRLAHDESILIVQMPIEEMQNKLPSFKSQWLTTGNTQSFISELKESSKGVWKVNFIRYEGIIYTKCD